MIDPIIIVGPGRCGTSALAGILYYLGVYMGEEFVLANENNPYGHWEDKEFHDLNDAVLNRRIAVDHWHYCIKQLINKRRSLEVPWGWKDPRTCHLLPHYLTYFREPKFIRSRRSPEAIEKSMVKAYAQLGWNLEIARACREYRERELGKYLPYYPSLEVDFDQLMRDPDETIQSIAGFLRINNLSEEKIRTAVNSIQSSG